MYQTHIRQTATLSSHYSLNGIPVFIATIIVLLIGVPRVAFSKPVTWYVNSPTIKGKFIYDADAAQTLSDTLQGDGYAFPISGSVYITQAYPPNGIPAQTDLSFPTGLYPKVAQLQLATDGILTDAGGTYSLLPYSVSGQYTGSYVCVADVNANCTTVLPVTGTVSTIVQPPLKCDASAGITPQVQAAKAPNSPPWQSDEYDSSDYTIGQKGCALTSLSMALEGFGFTVNPAVLNQLMDTFGGYVEKRNASGLQTASVNWSQAVAIANKYLPGSPGKAKWDPLSRNGSTSALDNQICVNASPVVVGVNLDASGDPGHYVLVTGETSSGDFQILDPGHGHTLLSQYNSQFSIRGTVTDPLDLSALSVSTGSPANLELIDSTGRATGFDPNGIIVNEDIPQSAYYVDREDTINPDSTTTIDATAFTSIDVRQPATGDFLIVLYGKITGTFDVQIDGNSQRGTLKNQIHLTGKIEAGSVMSYRVSYSSNDSAVTSASQVVGDVNGDGLVNCADLAIVKASFGKAISQSGFDPRADVNQDGVVNILDLSTVARAMPVRMSCSN